MTKVTRRDFIKLVGAGAAAASLSGCLPQPTSKVETYPGDPKGKSLTPSEYVSTVCRICPAGCGVLARVVDGRAVKIEGNPAHPLNHGKCCLRANAALQVLYDPDRVQGPLRRIGERGENKWELVSWEAAISQVLNRLGEIQGQGKEHALLFLHNASPGHVNELIYRFCWAFGSPNVVNGDGWEAERAANFLTQGWPDLSAYDWDETAYVLFFGGSFLEDWQPQVHALQAYSRMRRGRPDRRTRMVQIGPRYSVSAIKSDEWVPLLPGRQGALALGMAHVIIREQLYDHDFVSAHTQGFEELALLVLEQYAPETVAGLTGVHVETIKRLAREFAGFRPAVAVAGRGLGEGDNQLLEHLAIHSLNALVGSVDVPGGVLRPGRPPFSPWKSAPKAPDQPRIDEDAFPLAAGAFDALPKLLKTGVPYAPEVLFLYETNPLFEGAGTNLWRDFFQLIPFIVSFSSFLDESALYADLVLPNHTFLERWVDGTPPGGLGIPAVGIGQPVVRPLYNTRHTGDVLMTLARSLGGDAARYFPWETFEELLRFRAEGLYEANGSIQVESFDEFWSQFVERGVWFGVPYTYGQWRETLATPSGRFQFSQEQDEPTLPHYEPPSYAGDAAEYPLHLIPYRVIADAGCRAPNAPLLWEMYGLHLKEMWQNWVELNPETAEHLDIHDGDQVWVESPQGRIQLKARVYEGVMPDAVNIPMGGGHTAGGRWASQVGGGNVAKLVVPQTDPFIGAVAWAGARVRVYKE